MPEGTTKTSKETIEAPTMYREIEQEENVARGCVEVIEILAYDPTTTLRRHLPEKDGLTGEIVKDKDGNKLYVENPRKPYFCQDSEDLYAFKENNPKARIETYTIQLRKKTAQKYIDSPRNMKQFKREN